MSENDYGYGQRRAEAVSMSTERLRDAIRNTYKTEMRDGGMSNYARARINAFKNELRDRGELPERPESGTYLADDWKQIAAQRLFFPIEILHQCKEPNQRGLDTLHGWYDGQLSLLTSIVRGGNIDDILAMVEERCNAIGAKPWGRYAGGRD